MASTRVTQRAACTSSLTQTTAPAPCSARSAAATMDEARFRGPSLDNSSRASHGAGQHDRALLRGPAREKVHEEGAVLQRVGAVGDHDTVESPLKDGRAGPAGQPQHGRGRHVPAGLRHHVLHLHRHVRGERAGGDGLQELGPGDDARLAGAVRVGDGVTGRQQQHTLHRIFRADAPFFRAKGRHFLCFLLVCGSGSVGLGCSAIAKWGMCLFERGRACRVCAGRLRGCPGR